MCRAVCFLFNHISHVSKYASNQGLDLEGVKQVEGKMTLKLQSCSCLHFCCRPHHVCLAMLWAGLDDWYLHMKPMKDEILLSER